MKTDQGTAPVAPELPRGSSTAFIYRRHVPGRSADHAFSFAEALDGHALQRRRREFEVRLLFEDQRERRVDVLAGSVARGAVPLEPPRRRLHLRDGDHRVAERQPEQVAAEVDLVAEVDLSRAADPDEPLPFVAQQLRRLLKREPRQPILQCQRPLRLHRTRARHERLLSLGVRTLCGGVVLMILLGGEMPASGWWRRGGGLTQAASAFARLAWPCYLHQLAEVASNLFGPQGT